MTLTRLLTHPLPVDRTAVRVTGPGESWNPWLLRDGKSGCRVCFDVCPRIKTHRSFDLIGVRLGSLVVLGMLDLPKPDQGRTFNWVARCDCGCYTLRTNRQLRRRWREDDRCPRCYTKQGITGP